MNGLVRMLVALALAASVGAGCVEAASSAPAVIRSCGTVKAAGKAWTVAAAGIKCTSARALVRKVAPRVPTAGVAHIADALGLRCTGFAQKSKRIILCASSSGKLVNAQASS